MNKLPLTLDCESTQAVHLMVRYQQGDTEAGNAICEMYGQRVLRFLWARLPREDAYDVSQEVWLRIHTDRRMLYNPDRGPVYPWLVWEARKHLNDWLRKRKKVVLDIDEVPEFEVSTKDDDEGYRVLEAIETQAELWAALGKLEPMYREVIILRYFDQLSRQDCAMALDVPQGTYDRRHHVALNKLRAILGM